jgi:hypothetical protein
MHVQLVDLGAVALHVLEHALQVLGDRQHASNGTCGGLTIVGNALQEDDFDSMWLLLA